MGTYRAWFQSLAAFLLVGGPLPAQAQEEQPLKMVYAVWKDIGGAANTMRHMNKKTYDLVEAYAVLVKDSTGKVEVSQRHNKAGGSDRAITGQPDHRHRDRKAERAASRMLRIPSAPTRRGVGPPATCRRRI